MSTVQKLDLEQLKYEPYADASLMEPFQQSTNPAVNQLTKSLQQSVVNGYKQP